MALFTDTSIVTLDDLLQYEVTLAQIASSHGINVDTKINLASSAIGEKLLLWLLDATIADPQWPSRRLLGLSTVVVTPSLKRWFSFESLSRFFAEAYNIQLNSRFQGKWAEYQGEANSARDVLIRAGLGIVFQPLPQPATPLVTVGTGNLAAQSMFVQTAWVNANGDESALSPVTGLLLNNNSGITVAMAEGSTNVPPSAAGWNVYLSSSEQGPTRQNLSALSIGSSWPAPASGVIQGIAPSGGQQPDKYVAVAKRILRG